MPLHCTAFYLPQYGCYYRGVDSALRPSPSLMLLELRVVRWLRCRYIVDFGFAGR